MFRKKSIISVLLLAFSMVLLGGCGAKKLQNVKNESEANQIIDVLNENGIRANKSEKGEGERRTFEIYINGDDEVYAAAIQLMQDHCLGQPEPPPIDSSGLVPSLEVERQREQQRIKLNIESQLRKMPGVTCVEVNFVPPQDKSLALDAYKSTASVSVYYKTPTFPISKEDIASLVARSVPDLQPERVSVALISKPLRPLPDFKTAYNITRIALVSGIGFVTILAFVSIVFLLQKKRRKENALAQDFNNANAGETALLNENYDFDDDDDNDEKLP